jgi:molybdate transport system ATP-binding protein
MSLLEFHCRLHYRSGFLLDAAFETTHAVTALSGPSGSGKTTILSMIAGLRRPDAGFIRLGGTMLFDSRDGTNVPPEARRVGYVFQQHLLFPHLSVWENLLYGWRRRPSTTRPTDADRIIQVLDLGELLERKPATLSGGERQRVALGRALLCTPELLLLDEPLASVDPERKEQVLAYVERVLSEWRIPTLYVTHDPGEVRRICQRVVQVRNGRVVAAALVDAEAAGRTEARTKGAPPTPAGVL